MVQVDLLRFYPEQCSTTKDGFKYLHTVFDLVSNAQRTRLQKEPADYAILFLFLALTARTEVRLWAMDKIRTLPPQRVDELLKRVRSIQKTIGTAKPGIEGGSHALDCAILAAVELVLGSYLLPDVIGNELGDIVTQFIELFSNHDSMYLHFAQYVVLETRTCQQCLDRQRRRCFL